MAHKLLRASLVFSIMTFFCRILGFIRDMVAAYVFGVTPLYDAYLLSSRLPNLLRRLVAEGAFTQAFIPITAEYKINHEHELHEFLACVSGNLLLVVTVLAGIGIILAPLIISITAPGFMRDQTLYMVAVHMLKITFPYIIFISMTAFGTAVLNTYGAFGIGASTPILLNLALIGASLIALTQQISELILPWAMLVGGVLQLLLTYYGLKQKKLFFWPKVNWRHQGVIRVMKLMVPAIYGAAGGQINVLVGSIFASLLGAGSITWLYYASRFMELPLALLGVTLSTVLLPKLAQEWSKNDKASFNAIVDWGLRLVLILTLPAVIGLYLLAKPILLTLFLSGKFTTHDVIMASVSLQGYSLAIIGLILTKILASVCYAVQDLKAPVIISSVCIVVNIVVSAILMRYLGVTGIALATSIAAILNAGLLFSWIGYKRYYIKATGWNTYGMQILLANLIMAITLFYGIPEFSVWVEFSVINRVLALSTLVVVGGGIYLISLYLLGIKPQRLLAENY